MFNGPAAQGENATGSEIHVCGYLLPFQAVQIVFAQSAVFVGIQLYKCSINFCKQGVEDCQLCVGAALGFFFTLYCPGKALPSLLPPGAALRFWVICRVASCASASRKESRW